jgi:hypothetical protein
MSRVFIFSVTYTTCTHSAFDSYVQLKQLHYYMYPYLKNKGNQIPDEKILNRIIAENYQKQPNHEIFESYKDKDCDLLQIAKRISEAKHSLQLWGAPPIYIKDKSLPEGYGFYLAGEDGISNTKGRDLDDVNSWDRKSYRFYPIRERKQKSLRITYISIIPALFTFIYIITRKKKTFSSRRVSKA